MKTTQIIPLVYSVAALLCGASTARAQQSSPSPFVVDKTLSDLSEIGLPASQSQLRLELRVPSSIPNNPPTVEGDLTIGMYDWGSGQNGIFQLNNASWGGPGSWMWQRGTASGTPRVEMELSSSGKLTLFGNGEDKIVFRPTADGQSMAGVPGGAAGIFVNGARLVSEADLANSVIPEIQSVTMQVGTALSLGDVTGIVGTGSMAAGAGASVYGSGSLAFGTGSHVGSALTAQGTVPLGGTYANDAVALGNSANARGHGAMAFGTRANAATRQSIAIGEDAEASGGTAIWWQGGYDWGSVAVGTKSKASGTASSAFGLYATAMGSESVAVGPRAVTWPSAPGGIAMGWSASSNYAGSLAIGNMSRSLAVGGVGLGSLTFANGPFSTAIGGYSEATGAGMIAVGTAPDFAGLTANFNWDDLNSVVFIVGGGKAGEYVGGTGGWSLSDWAVTRRTALSVTRGGDLKANGKIEASKAGGILVADTIEAKDGLTRLRGTVLIERQGDISMGEFTDGPQP